LTSAIAAHSTRLLPVVAGATALAGYLRTLMPGMAFGDWGEMQTVPHVLGVAHPTGYPTYIILSAIAQVVPLGSIAFRANLLSAVLVSAAIGVAVAVLLRLGARPLIAVATALAMGAIPTVWAAATVAEVNPLHLLFVALLLHRALVWEEHRRLRDLRLGALLLGLALGNHLLIVFVAPCVALFVVWVGRRELAARPWVLAAAVAAGFVGLATYLYIPIAASLSPPLAYNHPVTIDAFLWLVSGTQFRGQFGFLSPSGISEFGGSLGALWLLLVHRASPVVPVLGAIGLAVLVRRRPAFGLMCVAILLANVYFWATYLRLEHYLLVPWLVLSIGTGVALESAARALASLAPAPRALATAIEAQPSWRPRFDAGVLVGGAALVFASWLIGASWATSDRSGDRSAEVFADAVLDALPPNAAILSEWDASTPLWHARYVLDRRPDVLIVDDSNIVYEGWVTRERRIAALICERPVFIIRLQDADLEPTRAAYRLVPVISVRVALGGPSAAVTRPVFRVAPLDPTACGTGG
jgi:hypothetical protein